MEEWAIFFFQYQKNKGNLISKEAAIDLFNPEGDLRTNLKFWGIKYDQHELNKLIMMSVQHGRKIYEAMTKFPEKTPSEIIEITEI
jgi:hypothetical protein